MMRLHTLLVYNKRLSKSFQSVLFIDTHETGIIIIIRIINSVVCEKVSMLGCYIDKQLPISLLCW